MTLLTEELDRTGLVNRGQLEQAIADLTKQLKTGQIALPSNTATPLVFAGATNHAPNSDNSYSKAAATVPGTLPGDPGDENQEDYRYFRQAQGDPVTVDAAHSVKAVGHSLYGGVEDAGAGRGLPDWDRVNGWIRAGSTGTLYDVALQLRPKLVNAGDFWYFNCRLGCLLDEIVPGPVEFYAGLWVKAGAYEGWAKGDPFELSYSVHGVKGTKHFRYRVIAMTDSGVSILSAVLDVPDAPDVLSSGGSWVDVFFNAGPGFFWFEIYREDVVAGTFSLIFTIRNSTDLFYSDIGVPGQPKPDWPTVSDDSPLAYAQTRTIHIGSFGGAWEVNKLTVAIPSSFNYSLVDNDGMFLRFGLTATTALNRQIGIDRIMWSTQSGAWAPDLLPGLLSDPGPPPVYVDPIPSVSPTSGNQGPNGGLDDPADPGSGGGLCILANMPVMVRDGRKLVMKRFQRVTMETPVKGRHRTCYQILRKRTATASNYYMLKTANGITYGCNARHVMIRDIETGSTIRAEQIVVGETMIEGRTLAGRRFKTIVIEKTLVPEPIEVGTVSLRHPEGLSRDGHGEYVAGWSRGGDRGLYSKNRKADDIGGVT